MVVVAPKSFEKRIFGYVGEYWDSIVLPAKYTIKYLIVVSIVVGQSVWEFECDDKGRYQAWIEPLYTISHRTRKDV